MTSYRLIGIIGSAALVATLAAGPAAQATPTAAYMTGTTNPWGQDSEDTAMNGTFGAGNWTAYNGFSSSIFTSGYNFIYLDGGGDTSTDFSNFIDANLTNIETFISDGGRMMINAARWDFSISPLYTGFGSEFTGGTPSYVDASSTAAITAAGTADGLGLNGAGTSWTGDYFAHEFVSGTDATCLIMGTNASDVNGCVFEQVASDNLFVGSETAPSFLSEGGQSLFQNELSLAASGNASQRLGTGIGAAVSPVPEPISIAIFGAGLTGLGLARMNRRRARNFA